MACGTSGSAAPVDSGADGGLPSTCTGPCAVMTLTVTFPGPGGSVTESFDRAQFGFNASDAGPPTLHLEFHGGGDPACPTAQSPTPLRTLVVEDFPAIEALDGAPITEQNGVTAALFDFAGTLTTKPLVKAATMTFAFRPNGAAKASPRAESFVAMDVTMTFPGGGTAQGHVQALHCDSMDGL
jgi:hypothetical protein